MVRLSDVMPPLYHVVRDAIGDDESLSMPDWQEKADANMLRRRLEEEHNPINIFLSFLLSVYSTLGNYVRLDLQVGEPVIPWTTGIIVLVLVHKRVSSAVFVLLAAFLFNINPLYVCVLYFGLWIYSNQRSTPKHEVIKSPVCDDYRSYKSEKFESKSLTSESGFDFVLIGNDVGTLFTGALLARVGYICCVLQPESAPPINVLTPSSTRSGREDSKNMDATSLREAVIGLPLRYNGLLNSAITHESEEGNVKALPIGTKASGYVHCLLRVWGGQGRDGAGRKEGSSEVHVLRPGEMSLLEDDDNTSIDAKQNLGKLLQWCHRIYANITVLTISKCIGYTTNGKVHDDEKAWQKIFPQNDIKWLGIATSMAAADIIKGMGDSSSSLSSLQSKLFALCSAVFSGEWGLPAEVVSGLNLVAGISIPQSGMYCIHGGYNGLRESFVQSIRYSGGSVLHDVPIQQIEVSTPSSNGASSATGVMCGMGTCVKASKGVISGMGMLCTMMQLLPSHVDTRQEMGALREMCPKMYVILRVSASSLRASVSDEKLFMGTYVECNEVRIDPTETETCISSENGESTPYQVVSEGGYARVWCPEAQSEGGKVLSDRVLVVVEMQAGPDLVRPVSSGCNAGPIVYEATAPSQAEPSKRGCRVGQSIRLSASQEKAIIARAVEIVQTVFGSAEQTSVVECVEVVPPFIGGHAIAGTIHKYSSTGSMKVATAVSGLYLCGGDLGMAGLAGEIQGGWAAASVASGYSARDLVNGRNIIADIQLATSSHK